MSSGEGPVSSGPFEHIHLVLSKASRVGSCAPSRSNAGTVTQEEAEAVFPRMSGSRRTLCANSFINRPATVFSAKASYAVAGSGSISH
jgi:hypothetical protein